MVGRQMFQLKYLSICQAGNTVLVSTVIRQAAVPVSTVIGQAGNTVPATVRQLRTRSYELTCVQTAAVDSTVQSTRLGGPYSRSFPKEWNFPLEFTIG